MSNRQPWKRIGAPWVSLPPARSRAGSTSASVDPSQPQRSDEELLTGDAKAQAEEAVLAEYPDATIERTETVSGGVYESHIVTADGDRLAVLVDEDFAVTCTETGGRGGRGPGGGNCPEDDAAGGTSESPGSESPSTEVPDSADGSSGS